MIHFSINKNLFLQSLNITKRAISSKNAIPVLSTIKIDVTNEGITLIGSNGQISIENFISQKDENAGLLINSLGSILLEASFFINVVSSLPDVTLDFKEIEPVSYTHLKSIDNLVIISFTSSVNSTSLFLAYTID